MQFVVIWSFDGRAPTNTRVFESHERHVAHMFARDRAGMNDFVNLVALCGHEEAGQVLYERRKGGWHIVKRGIFDKEEPADYADEKETPLGWNATS